MDSGAAESMVNEIHIYVVPLFGSYTAGKPPHLCSSSGYKYFSNLKVYAK